MDIRFVLPSEVEQLARNVVTSFPSKTPAALLQNMEGELHRPDAVTSAVLTTMEPCWAPS